MTTAKRAGASALALIIAAIATEPADAKSRRKPVRPSAIATIVKQNAVLLRQQAELRHELASIKKLLRPDAPAAAWSIPVMPQNPLIVAISPIPDVQHLPEPTGTLAGYKRDIAKSAKISSLTPVLAFKVAEILRACRGTRLVSAYRPGARVRGSGRPSLHGAYPSKAADLQGNPTCIRSRLARWKGGLSTDYYAVNHYHVSYSPGGREWGARFAHRGSKYAKRYAAVR